MTGFNVAELLEHAGANRRGNRFDCPKCGGMRTITHTAECFFCHHCQWKGNSVTLAKELGVYQHIPSAEYRELRRRQEWAHAAAARLYKAVQARRGVLLSKLRETYNLEGVAHAAGPFEASWCSLERIYQERPAIEQELDVLDTRSVADVFRVMWAAEQQGRA